jgi:hypothetical protein
MIEVKLKGKKYKAPSSWEDVTTEQYIKLNGMIQLFQNEEGELTIEPEKLVPRIMEIFTGIKRDELEDIYFSDYILLQRSINFISEQPKLIDGNNLDEFNYKNYVFKIKKFDSLTFGEFSDAQHLKTLGVNNYAKSIAIVIDVHEKRDIKKFKFKLKKLELSLNEKEKLINEMPCVYVNSINFFLLNGQRKYLKNIAHYLNLQALRLNWSSVLRATGVITSGLWIYVKRLLPFYKKPLIST